MPEQSVQRLRCGPRAAMGLSMSLYGGEATGKASGPGGDGKRKRSARAKLEQLGQDIFSSCALSGIKCWWRESWSSEVTVPFLNRTPALEGILDIALPTITKPCGLCFPTISPVPPCSSSRISCLNYWPSLLTRLPASTPAPSTKHSPLSNQSDLLKNKALIVSVA